jgi:hypothetical protein
LVEFRFVSLQESFVFFYTPGEQMPKEAASGSRKGSRKDTDSDPDTDVDSDTNTDTDIDTDTDTDGDSYCPINGDACKIIPLGDSITFGMSSSGGGYRVKLQGDPGHS